MRLRNRVWLLLCLALAFTAAAQTTAPLTATPSALFFRNPTGSALTQTITVSAANSVTATVSYALTIPNGWLKIAISGGTLTVTAQPNGLAAGVYTAHIDISAAGFASTSVLVVLSTVSIIGGSNPVPATALVVSPDSISFQAVQSGPGSILPPAALFNPSGNNYSWTAKSNQPWLTVTPASGSGDTALQLAASATGYAPGSYTGQVVITSGTLTATIVATFTVTASQSATMSLAPAMLAFQSDGTTSLSQVVQVNNTGNTPLTWTAQTTLNNGSGGTGSGNWLSISPSSGSSTTGAQAAGQIAVSVQPVGLSAGLYSGSVLVNGGGAKQTIPVYLVLGKVAVIVSRHELLFHYGQSGGSSNPSIFTLTGGPTNTAFTITPSTTSGGAWFTVTPVQGTIAAATAATPTTITVTPVTSLISRLSPGIYYGQLQIQTLGAAQESTTVRVVLKVFSSTELPRLRLDPGGAMFQAVQGSAIVPAASVTLSALNAPANGFQVNASVSTVSGGNWLSVNPNLAQVTPATPLQLSVTVNASGLLPNTYTGSIVFTPASSTAPPVSLKVTMVVTQKTPGGGTVTGPLSAVFTNPSQAFITQPELPNTVSVALLDAGGNPVPGATVTVRSSNGYPDLRLNDIGGGLYSAQYRGFVTGPLTLSGLAAYYSVASGIVTSNAFTVSGSMESAQPAYIAPYPGGGVSAASYATSPTPVAAGSLVALFGLGIAGTGGAAGPPFPLPSTLGNASLAVGGMAGSLIAASPSINGDQVNFQLPFELQGQSTAELVSTVGNVIAPVETVLLGAVPAIFTASESGTGTAIALHSDYTAVTSASPAAAGEVVLIYATGLGPLNETVTTGGAAPAQTSTKNPVTVQMGGQDSVISFSGLAPGFAGLYQVNAQVPAGLASGSASLMIFVSGNGSIAGITIPTK
jgi:uncharacterized protein (TIGR03437 family)